MAFQTREERLAANSKKAEENLKKREVRKLQRESRKEVREALRQASGTKERRAIKAAAEKYTTPKPPSDAGDVAGTVSGIRSNADSEAGTDGGGGGGGGGLPDGYVETDVILCVNGSPVNGKFLFKVT